MPSMLKVPHHHHHHPTSTTTKTKTATTTAKSKHQLKGVPDPNSAAQRKTTDHAARFLPCEPRVHAIDAKGAPPPPPPPHLYNNKNKNSNNNSKEQTSIERCSRSEQRRATKDDRSRSSLPSL